MANPQKEYGYTAIANKLLESILKSELTLREMKIVFTVIRFTYGFNRKEAELAVRFIAEGTGIKFHHISKSIKTLQEKNVLILSASESHSQGRMIKLNKDYESWIYNRSQKSNGSVTEKVTVRVTKKVTKKDNNKENINTGSEQFLELIPDTLRTDEFIATFKEWIEYRISIKKKLTALSIKKQLKFLEAQPNPIKCIEQSIMNQWQGLFEIKSKNSITAEPTKQVLNWS